MRLPRPCLAVVAAAALALVGCSVTVQIDDGRWTAHCVNVSADDCRGVAELFTNNLAWGEGWAHDESGGVVQVSPLVPCPISLPEFIEQGTCWRAWAPTRTQRACMLVGRQKDPDQAPLPFGQVGGDEYTGRLGADKPGTEPC